MVYKVLTLKHEFLSPADVPIRNNGNTAQTLIAYGCLKGGAEKAVIMLCTRKVAEHSTVYLLRNALVYR